MQVIKFSPDGKVLLTLGKAGQGGSGTGRVRSADRRGLRAERRHLHLRRPCADLRQFAHHEVRQERKIHQDLRPSGIGRRRIKGPHVLAFDARDASSSPTAATAASRSSIRTANSSPPGTNSAGRAASGSTRTTCCTSPIPNPKTRRARTRTIRAASAASASAASKDGKVQFYIPPPPVRDPKFPPPEGVAADSHGNIYAAAVPAMEVYKYVKN